MFNSIEGVVTEKPGSGVRLLTGGIEWDVFMPGTDAEALPEVGKQAKVYTWLQHREDAMTLFGFITEERRATFHELLKVDGIGVKGALKIMGGISQEELIRALEAGNLERLESVPGLGKKTAQKMLLTLKGKLVHKDESAASSPYAELASALTDMGYERKSALAALDKAAAEIPADSANKEDLLFRKAILYLSR